MGDIYPFLITQWPHYKTTLDSVGNASSDFLKYSCILFKLLFLDLRMTNIQTSVTSLLGTVKALIKWNIFSSLKEHEHPEIIFHFQFTLLGTKANPFSPHANMLQNGLVSQFIKCLFFFCN